MNIRKVIVGLAVAALPVAGLVACGSDDYATVAVAEDCDVEDQHNHEDDCGYWQKGQSYRAGRQPDATWLWVWYPWVVVDRLSTPPAGWKAPHGITFPTKTVRVNRKNCALGAFAPAPPRPAPAPARAPAPAPAKPANGNAPRNDAPRAPKAPVYAPPKGQKVSC